MRRLGFCVVAAFRLAGGGPRHTSQFLAREQEVTEGLLSEALNLIPACEKFPWPITTGPVKLGLGGNMRQRYCPVPVEGTAAYATQRVLCYLDCL